MNSMTGLNPAGGPLRGNPAGNFRGDIIPKGYRTGQLQQFTPQQMDLFSSLFGQVGPNSQLARLARGDQGSFSEMEAPYWKEFQEAQGQLGSRFSQFAPGAMSAQRGSGFMNASGQLGSNFAMQLASRRQELQRQALFDLMGLSQSLLGQRPYDRFLEKKPEKQSSGWGPLIGGVAGGVGGAFLGQPLLGAQLGSMAGSYF